MNTELFYLYRDGSNYKRWNGPVIVEGDLTLTEKEEIISCLQDGERFIPEAVGLPAQRFEEKTEDDWNYMELRVDDIESVAHESNCSMTAQQLLENFRELKGKWNEWESENCPTEEEPIGDCFGEEDESYPLADSDNAGWDE